MELAQNLIINYNRNLLEKYTKWRERIRRRLRRSSYYDFTVIIHTLTTLTAVATLPRFRDGLSPLVHATSYAP